MENLTDTHAHLFYPDYAEEIDEVIERAVAAGVESIIVPATDLESAKKVVELTKKYDIIYGAVGVHPLDSKEWEKKWRSVLEKIALKNKKIVAIGEIGLDYYYDYSPKEKQIEAFREQLELAIELKLPVIVHNRDSDDDMMDVIREYTPQGLRAHFHCFNASLEHALEYVRMGHMISFTGNLTFKKADELRRIAAAIHPEHLLLETDSPYMTPVPNRGKRNEPANVQYIAGELARQHNLTPGDIARITKLNARLFYGVGEIPPVSIVYPIGSALYVNVTNRCNADCIFCSRQDAPFIAGYNLGMEKREEPTALQYLQQIGDPTRYSEIVFCGYGEPTIRWEVVKQIARRVKELGGKTRMNTNGHGNVINHKDITPEMAGVIDSLSVSLNAVDSKTYANLMGVDENMYYEMLDFTKKAKEFVPNVVLSVVSLPEIDTEKARRIAEVEIGVAFRERAFF
ncbi:MAG: YchF/TatD family DNA exonuclease [Ignavibacteriales bacterium]|nr:MAG: YchF/TatD family DNA exonuclease [Ignavibacteriaceae bacterium]MBW7871828.1 YchF/TatD family DNA exonuclease [Ignavibacteria bacterium]MCZ2144322.1 YchF/TatD family DNA exonuclease [Ignavibacteriales bacterium]OQY72232.1 MAG: radical SAM protein [Ignavibacteriales bacterium UTCHB3]MBV6446275.1 Tat-linked quality control protein TatD [Ignavibacteriaceae bacterium]